MYMYIYLYTHTYTTVGRAGPIVCSPAHQETVNWHISSRAGGVWSVSPLVFQGDNGFALISFLVWFKLLEDVTCTWSGCGPG